MVKESFVKFSCDTCKNESYENEQDGFPYSKGWVYIYQLSGQMKDLKGVSVEGSGVYRFEIKDKHFCSEKCSHYYIGRAMKGEIAGVGASSPPQQTIQPQNEHF